MSKIVFVTVSLESGGTENYLLRFLKYLLKEKPNLNITIICKGGKTGSLFKDFEKLGISIEIFKLGYLNLKNINLLNRKLSRAIYTIKELVKRGAKVKTYDPKAMEEAKNFYLKNVKEVEYFDSKYEVLKNSEALILLTEWKEFRSPDFSEIKSLLINPIIFDGRNQFNAYDLRQKGFEYYQIGKNI